MLLMKRNEENGKLHKLEYDSICRAISAYKAVDILNKEHICATNYYLVIWLYDGEEPDDYKVKIGMDQLDADNNHHISLDEWIKFLCLSDSGTHLEFFKGDLRKRFVRLDTDHSGELDKDEAKKIIKESLKDWAKDVFVQGNKEIEEKFKKQKDTIELTIDAIVIRLFRKMQVNSINWQNFSEFLLKSSIEIEELKRFLFSTFQH